MQSAYVLLYLNKFFVNIKCCPFNTSASVAKFTNMSYNIC